MRRFRLLSLIRGLCHSRAGFGKTLSARRYAHWDLIEPLVTEWGKREDSDAEVYAASARARTLFYTAPISGSLSALRKDIQPFIARLSICIDSHERPEWTGHHSKRLGPIELVIVDETERLTMTGLEFLRDQFDRSDAGLILMACRVSKSACRNIRSSTAASDLCLSTQRFPKTRCSSS